MGVGSPLVVLEGEVVACEGNSVRELVLEVSLPDLVRVGKVVTMEDGLVQKDLSTLLGTSLNRQRDERGVSEERFVAETGREIGYPRKGS